MSYTSESTDTVFFALIKYLSTFLHSETSGPFIRVLMLENIIKLCTGW